MPFVEGVETIREGTARLRLSVLVEVWPVDGVPNACGLHGSFCTPHRYVGFIYSLDYLQAQQRIGADQALAMGVICNFTNLLLAPVSGAIVDKYGVGCTFLLGEVCACDGAVENKDCPSLFGWPFLCANARFVSARRPLRIQGMDAAYGCVDELPKKETTTASAYQPSLGSGTCKAGCLLFLFHLP